MHLCSGIEICLKSQSYNVNYWKFKLKTDIGDDRFKSYQQKFSALKNNENFETVFLAFEDFHQDLNGNIPPDETPLDLTRLIESGYRVPASAILTT